jgi:thioredoxin 1
MLLLSNRSDYDALLARSQDEPVLIYKHSSICGLSNWSRRKLSELTTEQVLPVYQLIVQTARSLSNQIEAEWGIRHESPQVILLYRGRVLYHASHTRIAVDDIREALPHTI